MSGRTWIVVVEPQGKNPGTVAKAKAKAGIGQNEGGLVVYLAKGDYSKEEVGRVGFIRGNTSNPRIGLKAMTEKMAKTAWEAADLLDEQQRLVDETLNKYPKGEMQ